MNKVFSISLFRIISALLITILTVLLIVEVTKEENIIVETLDSCNVSLYDSELEEVDCIEFNNFNPYEEITYFIKLENYNENNLKYRVVFDVLSSVELSKYIDITFGDELLIFTNYRAVSNWCSTNDDELLLKFKIKLNSSNNNLQDLSMNFDFRIESIK